VSTHPPFDPELRAAMAALAGEELQPLRAEDIPAWLPTTRTRRLRYDITWPIIAGKPGVSA
jgi:hypothetical protein